MSTRWSNEEHTAFAEITTMPGSPQVAIIHNVYVSPGMRRQGIGSAAHYRRLQDLQGLGYTMALCTTDKQNEAEHKILERHGWRWCSDFYNPATDHVLQLWCCDLQCIQLPQQALADHLAAGCTEPECTWCNL